MKPLPVAAVCLGLALLTFFRYPGHTWLQQDTQIYLPILEHQRDPAALRNDILAQQPHVAFTLYDEVSRGLRAVTGQAFREVLAAQQVATRALGIWGFFLMATALGLNAGPAFVVAAICGLGATITGPQVLSFEYEPTPRAFAVPLIFCAMGLAARRRHLAAAIAAACAFLYHPPTALPFWALFVVVLVLRRRLWALAPLLIAALVLALMAHGDGGQAFFGRLTPLQEQLQRMRTPYSWISTWHTAWIVNYCLLFAIAAAALAKFVASLENAGKVGGLAAGIASEASHKTSAPGPWPPAPFSSRRVPLRYSCRKMSLELELFLLGLPILGLLSMPLSWLLLERWRWVLMPQIQPMRMLLFVAVAMQFLTAAAAVRAAVNHKLAEAFTWFAFAYLLPLQPVLTEGLAWPRLLLALPLAAVALVAVRLPVLALAAFFILPVAYPALHTPQLDQLSAWARTATPRDAVFLFPDAGRSRAPGIFRAEALRAVYVDWKGGGQVNYRKSFAEEWWKRWQLTMNGPIDLPQYQSLGIAYIVVQPEHRLPQPPAFQNAAYVAYPVTQTVTPLAPLL